jgi:hypothetical protein
MCLVYGCLSINAVNALGRAHPTEPPEVELRVTCWSAGGLTVHAPRCAEHRHER